MEFQDLSATASVNGVRATAWHNGGPPSAPAGYGIKFSTQDRDRHFDPKWSAVTIEMEGGGSALVALTPSFWRSCSELRSADIGRWLLETGAAPWPSRHPPGIAVNHVGENRFAARVLTRHNLPGSTESGTLTRRGHRRRN